MATAARSRPRTLTRPRATGKSPSGSTRGQSIAQGLGWFSIGLGLAQVIAPRRLARLIGVDEDDDRTIALMRAIGFRELASGMGIFSQRNDAAFLWGRVAGDAMDVALLASAMSNGRNDRARLLGATAAVAGAAALDVLAARQRSNPEITDMAPEAEFEWQETEDAGGSYVKKSITINRPQEDVSRELANISTRSGVLQHLHAENVSVSLKAGRHEGETEVHVEIAYEPRGGKLGSAISKLRHKDPGHQVLENLRHLKQVVEVGEIVHSDASIHGGPHPAQPDSEARI